MRRRRMLVVALGLGSLRRRLRRVRRRPRRRHPPRRHSARRDRQQRRRPRRSRPSSTPTASPATANGSRPQAWRSKARHAHPAADPETGNASWRSCARHDAAGGLPRPMLQRIDRPPPGSNTSSIELGGPSPPGRGRRAAAHRTQYTTRFAICWRSHTDVTSLPRATTPPTAASTTSPTSSTSRRRTRTLSVRRTQVTRLTIGSRRRTRPSYTRHPITRRAGRSTNENLPSGSRRIPASNVTAYGKY